MGKTGIYINSNIFHQDTPETFEELLKDSRYRRMDPLAKDAAAAKYLHMSYGQYQSFKVQNAQKYDFYGDKPV